MKRRWLIGILSIIIAITGTAFTRDLSPAPANNPPPGPDRITVVTVEYTAYEWYMATWKGQNFVCNMIVDHEGVPLPGEVYRDCGQTIYNKWIVQAPCLSLNKNLCKGYYIYQVDSWPAKKDVAMKLDPATAWISLEDCEPVPSTSTNICESTPTLVITGKETLQDQTINRIAGTYDGESFECSETDTCKFHIQETDPEGVEVTFWAYSTYGDSSEVFTARVRVQKADEGDPDQLYWYVDVLSSQWAGETSASCAQSWEVFPPVGGTPDWLSTPRQSEELSSDIPYTYLAANLIMQGAVDANMCADGGLAPGGVANQCGLEQARPAVTQWQNQFDDLILSTAKDTGVPARLIKNLFARESQFWPGLFLAKEDAGLGQLTEDGADTTLFWNPFFYEQFCPMVLPKDTCAVGYMHLDTEQQVQLRKALLDSVNATCENCPLGIDLDRADFSITTFAHTMIANCEQTGQIIYNYTLQSPGAVASYEDLWKFTLVNYNAGGSCLAEAVTNAYSRGLPLTWDNVSPYLVGACLGAVDYVNDISK